MRAKANRFSKSMEEMTPRNMKGAMGKAYLAKKIELFMSRYNSLLQRWSFILGCLHIEVTYDMWEDNVRSDGKAEYDKWLNYSNKIVISLHICMTDPNSGFEKAVSRAKKAGLGCVLMSEVKKHLKSMDYSKGFEDLLTGHMVKLTSVDGELKSKGTAEGSTAFDARLLTDKEDDKLIKEVYQPITKDKAQSTGGSKYLNNLIGEGDTLVTTDLETSEYSENINPYTYNSSDTSDISDVSDFSDASDTSDQTDITNTDITNTDMLSLPSEQVSTESSSISTYLFTDN